MTTKFNKASAGQYYSTPDQPAFTIPASPAEWTIAFILSVDGLTTGTGPQAIISTGGYQEAGNFNVFYNPAGEPSDRRSRVSVWLGSLSAPLFSTTTVLQAGETYLYVLYHTGTRLYAKRCPILATEPTLESAPSLVVAEGSGARSVELDTLHGIFVGARTDLSSTRWLDQSVGRLFYLPGLLTDYEIAQLAYGKEITELGKQPIWYLRLDNADDTQARGSSQAAFEKHGSPTTSAQQPAFGYVPTPPAPPAISGVPSIDGSPQVGVPSSYTPAGATGYPKPVRSQEWLVAGAVVGSAPTYTPMTSEATKGLQVRQIETSPGDGSTANAVSASKTIAAASSDTITVIAPPAETVKQRVGSAAPVPLSGTYTGTAPSSIEYQLYSEDGMTVLRPWAALTATISGGNWSATPNVPLGGPYRVSVRGRSSSAVLGTSAIAPEVFLVGGIGACIGSSTPERWFNQASGTPFLARPDVRRAINGSWTRFGVDGCAIEMANRIAAHTEMPIGLLDNGVSGTLLTEWTNPNGARWSAFRSAVMAVGGKLEFLIFSMGSNDLSNDAIASRAAHLANLRLVVQNARAMTGQPNLPVFLSGVNRRVRTGLNEQMASDLRMAESDLPENEQYVGHIQTMDFELSSDGTHLSSADAGMPAQGRRIAYVVGRAIKDGIFVRGPKMTSYAVSGNDATVSMVHRNGAANDFSPPSSITGFIGYDSGNAVAALLSATHLDSSRVMLSFDRPVSRVTYLEGAGPAVGTPIYDNGAAPLPMHVETYLAATEGPSQGDVTAPVMSGSIAVSGVTQTGFTMGWSAATDNVGVDHYETSINGGSSWSSVGASLSRVVTGAAAGSTFQLRVRAHDNAGNQSNVLSGTATTASASDTTAPVLTGQLAVSNITHNSADLVWPTASDNVGVVGYERSLDSGATWTAVGSLPNATLSGLVASAAYQVQVRAYDSAGNRSAALSKSFSTQAAPGNPDPEMSFTPSPSRTLTVSPTSKALTGGPWWNLTIPSKPRGAKDPQATLDVTLNWAPWLADIGNPAIAKFTATIFGVTKVGAYAEGALTTMVFSGGTGTEATITFEIETATTPPLKDERTVYIDLVNQ